MDELDDTQVDALLNSEAPSRDIPMNTPETPAPTAWAEDKFTHGGKEIKGTREQILKWAEMGYGYPQKAAELNRQAQTWQTEKQQYDARIKEYESKFTPYKEVDEYAAKNPQWWQEVQQAYQAKLSGAQNNSDVTRIKQELLQELAPLKEFMQSTVSEKQAAQIKDEDTKLSQEVESIRKSFANLDFDTPDENGKSLEIKILEHAEANGIGSFRVAFRDFYHDQLMSKAREEGKEALAKEKQKQTKLGVLGETSKPTKGLKVAEGVRNKSYEDLKREALEELGIAN